ncbi:hypothetical protein [Mesorhizobium sp. AR10]|uniref:hypothetical protein n=1 Tax=Mesorhizobium sp. AR10 TaxID=2865839 RepID=UPI0021609F49|nr:hypothetical protein [Mesorhizobium sp. AR10]
MGDYRANAQDLAQDEEDADIKSHARRWGANFGAAGKMFDVPKVWAEMADNLRAVPIERCGHPPSFDLHHAGGQYGLTGGSTPDGDVFDREIVIVSTAASGHPVDPEWRAGDLPAWDHACSNWKTSSRKSAGDCIPGSDRDSGRHRPHQPETVQGL